MTPLRSTDVALQDEARQRLAAERWKAEPPEDTDPLRLIHELRVHQIELQMQNEVLTETLGAVNTLRAKYMDLFDTAPVGYLTLDTQGRILELNLRAASMLSNTRERLVGQSLRHFFEPQAVAALDALLSGTVSGATGAELAASALQISRSLPVPLYVNALARRSADPATGQSQIRLVLMDVSALKMATDDVVKSITAGF